MPWPNNVGILALEIIFPAQYVSQTELERHDGATAGKYTLGLGQQGMGFCSDREDINSLCLTVVHKLMDRYGIKPSEIGRLEVGTETIIDKSKSVKSVLMQLFEPHGVTDVEGIDTTNACYGGTAALFNSLAWIESSAWDGRYALVVAADIAVYAKGAARPTGGAGAVAMLLGPDAPLVFDRGFRSTCIRHTYDFYKPDLTSEYPIVDGKLSIQCYLNALDTCYRLYCERREKRLGGAASLNDFDAVLFHSPYCKLVQKSLARLALMDFLRSPEELRRENYPGLEKFEGIDLENSYFDKDVEKAFLTFSNDQFIEKTKPSLLLASQVGNMYTPSLYGGLVSLLMTKEVSQLIGNRVLFFSYGSGLAASIFSMTITKDPEGLSKIMSKLKYNNLLLERRLKVNPKTFEDTLELRQKSCHKAPYVPVSSIEHFFPGTYYLVKIDEKFRRFYERVPLGEAGFV